jgi:hypothetical protein
MDFGLTLAFLVVNEFIDPSVTKLQKNYWSDFRKEVGLVG